MPVSEERIRQLLDAEEPDYRAAAAEVGADGLLALSTLVQEADTYIAAAAASLVATIAADATLAEVTVPVLALAAEHDDAGVRAVAAFGASRVGAAGESIIANLLSDVDAGVRRMAFRGLAPPLSPVIAAAVRGAAAGDPAPSVRNQAVALAARNPDPALGNELIAGALDYIQARLAELRDTALLDVPSLANAVDAGGFDDVGGFVADRLVAARAALRTDLP